MPLRRCLPGSVLCLLLVASPDSQSLAQGLLGVGVLGLMAYAGFAGVLLACIERRSTPNGIIVMSVTATIAGAVALAVVVAVGFGALVAGGALGLI
jgi:hypothetical protein